MFNRVWSEHVGLGHIGLDGTRIDACHESAVALQAYWASKRDAAGVVRWSDIQPSDITSLLPHLFLAEPIRNTDWRYRLFGTGVSARFGIDFTNKTILEIYEPVTADAALRLYRKVVDRNQPRVFSGRYLGLALEHLVVEVPHLPVLGRFGQAWVLGGVFFCPRPIAALEYETDFATHS